MPEARVLPQKTFRMTETMPQQSSEIHDAKPGVETPLSKRKATKIWWRPDRLLLLISLASLGLSTHVVALVHGVPMAKKLLMSGLGNRLHDFPGPIGDQTLQELSATRSCYARIRDNIFKSVDDCGEQDALLAEGYIGAPFRTINPANAACIMASRLVDYTSFNYPRQPQMNTRLKRMQADDCQLTKETNP